MEYFIHEESYCAPYQATIYVLGGGPSSYSLSDDMEALKEIARIRVEYGEAIINITGRYDEMRLSEDSEDEVLVKKAIEIAKITYET